MRNTVIKIITEWAKTDDRIMLVTGDLGFHVLDEFAQSFPDRFINTGIAEQNMASVAAGLALEGNMVFVYSIGNFPTLRCIEQLRNDVCYHKANVKVLSVGGGFAYGDLGMSHHATEDIAVMRSLPQMRVYAPADSLEAVCCLKDACGYYGPAFIRMARGKEPEQHKEKEKMDVSSLISMQNNSFADISIITTGTILSEAVRLRGLLQNSGFRAEVFSCPRVKPIASDRIKELAVRCRLMVTMEDHNVIGGLGGAAAEILSEMDTVHAPLLRIGLEDTYTFAVGSQDYIRDFYGLSAGKVFARIMNRMGL